MKKKLFFIISTVFFLHCLSSQDYYFIKVNNKKIPSLIEWPKINNFKNPFDVPARLVIDKKLYLKYIFPFKIYLELTDKPILIWQTQYHNTNGNAYGYFQPNKNKPHSILIPAPAYKYLATILHELVHIYIEKKRVLLNFSLKKSIFNHDTYSMALAVTSLAFLPFINESYALFLNIHCFIQLWFTLTAQNRWNQLEEIICDSYAGIIFADKAKNLNLIENDIHYFKKEIMQYPEKNNSFTNFIQDVCCFSTHPSSQKRLKHLLAMKQLVNENKKSQIHQWIKKQEDVLFKSKTFFQLGIVPHL